jgi:hypothetical protein
MLAAGATTGQGVDIWRPAEDSEAYGVKTGNDYPVHAGTCQSTHGLAWILEDTEVSLDAGEGGCW